MRVDQKPQPQGGVPPPVDLARIGPETKAVLFYLTLLIDAVYNAAVLASGATTAGGKSASPAQCTPGEGTQIFENKTQIPMYLHVRVQPPGTGSTCFMLLAGEKHKLTLSEAAIVRFGEAPEAQVLVRPGERLWGDVQTPSTGNQVFLYTLTPLTGARGILQGA